MVEVWYSSILCFGLGGACVGLRMEVSCVLCHLMYCSIVVCLYLVVFVGGFRWGITLGAGKAMLMRGGACATELYLMVGCVCLSSSGWWWLSLCGLCGCIFLFLMFSVLCIFGDLSLYGFGGGGVISIG